MAKTDDVQVSATPINAQMLPSNFSRAYQLYVLQQSNSLVNIANKANSAGQDAADAQEKNDEQDKTIASQGETLEKISGDYVSKSAAEAQSVSGSFGATSFTVSGVQVVGGRVTGYTVATGSAHRGAFSADADYDTDTAPAGLKEARQRIKALEDALRAHGLIGE
ncbi:DNA stabilization protein [Erwinia psidii]|uniref:DNA stabilization protein n=1 Tax=Erwinia psidii TaxID=69224 RepID=UPI00226B1593|nr:DNA stabilization protein [Erwinia psidii]MCX8958317.1 DNA stabilization protein [Erwinia psidii]MCX8963252.1 DNA stabilization protein [Erwinia psidii]MCX8965123.1 DNA stabilization protein [Erwinia psidii]